MAPRPHRPLPTPWFRPAPARPLEGAEAAVLLQELADVGLVNTLADGPDGDVRVVLAGEDGARVELYRGGEP